MTFCNSVGANGKENGSYYIGFVVGITEKKMETTGIIGIIQGYKIGVNIGTMEKKMVATV